MLDDRSHGLRTYDCQLTVHCAAGFSPPPLGQSQDDFIVPADSPLTAKKPFLIDTPSRYPWNAAASPSGNDSSHEPSTETDPPRQESTVAPHMTRPAPCNTPHAGPAAAYRPLKARIAAAFRPLSSASPRVPSTAFFKFIPAPTLRSIAVNAHPAETGQLDGALGVPAITPGHRTAFDALSSATLSSAGDLSDSSSAASPPSVSACLPAAA